MSKLELRFPVLRRRWRFAAALIAVAWVVAAGVPADSHAQGLGPYPPLGSKCGMFPKPGPEVAADAPSLPDLRAWSQDVSQAPVHPDSQQIIDFIDAAGGSLLHPDFGSSRRYGIPYAVVGRKARRTPVRFRAYGDESDRGKYRIPLRTPVEGGAKASGDRHVLAYDRARCKLYELYRAFPRPKRRRWAADSGVIWNLRSAEPRRAGWTSADAAGLPIMPGLARYDEVARGAIDHAFRVTFRHPRRSWVRPASHCVGSAASQLAPIMGMRLRLRGDFDLAGFSGQARTTATALKRYGLIVADIGTNWYFQGTSDRRWNDANLSQLKSIPGSAFEVVRSEAPHHDC